MIEAKHILTPRLITGKHLKVERLKVKLICLHNFNIEIHSNRGDKTKIIEELRQGFAKEVELEPNERVIYVSRENLNKALPSYLEFSISTYKNPYYCIRGIVIASSEDRCPVLDECKVRRGDTARCYYYIRSRSTFLGLYRIFADFRSRVDPISEEGELDTIKVKIRDHVYNLMRIVLHRCSITETVACIRLERRELRRTLLLFPCSSYRKKHSRRILNVPTIVLWVNDNALYSLIEGSKDNEDVKTALNWCKFKYAIISTYFEDVFLRSKHLSSFFPRSPWHRSLFYKCTDHLADEVSKGKVDISAVEDPSLLNSHTFRKFLMFTLLNTLAHIIVGYLCSRYGCAPSYFSYIIDVDRGELYIYERVTGGLGYIEVFYREYLSELCPRLHGILAEWYNGVVKYEENILMKERTTNIKISERDLQGCSQDFRNALKSVCRVNEQLLGYKLYLPISILRRVLCEYVDPDNQSDIKLLNGVLEVYNACFDGCKICVLQDKLGPLSAEENAFLVSRSLVEVLLKYLNDFTENSPRTQRN